MRRCASMLIVCFMVLAGPLSLFSYQGTAQEAESTASSSDSEPGPVFVSDQWRISVVAGVRNAGINAVGLTSGIGQDWLLVVADVSNWGSEDATLNVTEFDIRAIDEIDGPVGGIATDGAGALNTGVTATALNLRAGPSTETDILSVIPEGAVVTLLGGSENGFFQVSYDGMEGWAFAESLVLDGDALATGQPNLGGPSFFVPQSTIDVASQLGTEPSNVEAGVSIAVDETIRVSLVFQVPSDLEDPVLIRNTSLPLDEVLASAPNLNELPEIVPAPSLVEARVDDVTDGRTIRLFLPADDSSLTLKLLGVDSPIEDECFAQEATDRLRTLAGDTVWLESDADGDDMARYVWAEQNGTRVLVNQALIAEGYAGVADMGQNTRFTTWFAEAERTAQAGSLGLWAVCTGPGGTLLPTPTPVPPTPTPTPSAEEIRAQYTWLADVRELAIRPAGLIGDEIAFSGEIFTIQVAGPGDGFILGDRTPQFAGAAMQVWVTAPDGSREAVFVGYDGDTSGMFEGTWVTIYGTVVGTHSGTNRFGGTITQPLVMADIIDIG